MCSEKVKDSNLLSLEDFVNKDEFSVDHVITLGEAGLKTCIQHLGFGN